MNIHVSKLLFKMEKEIQKAKVLSNDKEIRERISIIHSLCEVILEEKSQPVITSQPVKDFNQLELQKMMGSQVNKPSNLAGEDSVNGDSIFDF